MLELKFTKTQALGNDFVVIEDLENKINLDEEQIRKLCDRRLGIGADGVLLLLSSDKSDFQMRIFNKDGTEAEACGNGIRCLAAYIHEKGLCKESKFTVETIMGEKEISLNLSRGTLDSVRVRMGKPGHPVNEVLRFEDIELEATCISMGNPHCVVIIGNVQIAPVDRLGPAIEKLSIFEEGTNVEFVQMVAPDELIMRVWERGVGETPACGTGACASVVAAVTKKLADNQVTVHLGGGDLKVDWASDGYVYLTGPASLVFSGEMETKI